jgi:C4-dicarboxylate transporter DctM subunit
MDWHELLLILVAIFSVLMLLGLPVAFSMSVSGIAVMLMFFPSNVINQIVLILFRQCSNFTLLTIPLFILMAGILTATGLTSDLFDSMKVWCGSLPGGLGVASVAACTVFGALCGSTAATTAAIGLIAIPEMRKADYDGTFATAILASGGTLGTLIPPSNTAILYGVITETSIGKIFIANIIPGLLLSAMFMVFIVVMCIKYPHLAPNRKSYSYKEKLVELKKVGPIIFLISVVLGSIYGGLCTPSESAALGCIGALIIAITKKKLSIHSMQGVLKEVITGTCGVMMLFAGTYILGHVLIYGDIATHITESILAFSSNKAVIIIMVYALFIVLGMFIEPMAIVCLVVPLLYPVLVTLGYDPIWIGVMCVVVSMIGNVSPPVGVTMYIAHSYSSDLPLDKLMIQVIPFILVMAVHLALITIFPAIVMWLPNNM